MRDFSLLSSRAPSPGSTPLSASALMGPACAQQRAFWDGRKEGRAQVSMGSENESRWDQAVVLGVLK